MTRPTPLELLAMDASAVAAALDELDAASLETLIRRANREYWDEQRPTMPDPLYDQLVEALRAQDPDAGVLRELGERRPEGPVTPADQLDRVAPERRFGAAVEHLRPMLSLDKCYDDAQLAKWAGEFTGEVLAMPKLDGVALSLRYDAAGALQVAATRGDGRVGEDVTKNILLISDIPHTLPDVQRPLEVRGEVFMRLSAFARFAETYKNPRNLTAGTLKQKDGDVERCRHLSFFAYDLLGDDADDETVKFDRLRQLGFSHPEGAVEILSSDALAENFRGFGSRRPELDYEIDGVVYRASARAEQRRLGETAHHPRWSIAYKFQGDSGETRLEDVGWSVSRTGTITPVALLEPISLSGAMIGRSSLHNLSRFHALNLAVGCTVEVTRRGGVIPMVERVLGRPEPAEPFAVPEACPACEGPVVVRREREADFLQCEKFESCQQAKISSLEHFAKVADIQGFGPKVIGQCFDREYLRVPADFYQLEHADLASLERMGTKSADNLLAAVAERTTLDLPTFLQALGIQHLGRQYAELLADRYETLDATLAATREELVALHGVSELVATALLEGLETRAEIIAGLQTHITVTAWRRPEAPSVLGEHPLRGKSVLFTGTLEQCDRKSAQAMVTAVGGVAARSVTAALDVLVIGAGRGAKSSKQKKAEALVEKGASIELMGEAEFLALVGPDRT